MGLFALSPFWLPPFWLAPCNTFKRLFKLGSKSEAPPFAPLTPDKLLRALELALAFAAARWPEGGGALPKNELKSKFESKSIVTEPPPGKGAVCCVLRGDCCGEPDALAAEVRGCDRTFL